MGWAAIALDLAAGAIQAYGQWESGKAAKKSAYYEADMLEYNAKVALLEAELALDKAEAEETLLRQEGRKIEGQQRVAVGWGGAVADTGSAFDVLADTAKQVERDASNIRFAGALEAWRARQRAWEYMKLAELRRYEGRLAKKAYERAAVVSAMAGASHGAGTYQSTYGGSGSTSSTQSESSESESSSE